MTFNKMRFPIVWITFALYVVLCSFNEVECGPSGSRQNVDTLLEVKDQVPASPDHMRSARQAEYDDDEEDDDDEEQRVNSPEPANRSEEDDDDEDYDYFDRRSLRRSVREASQKPVIEVETEDESAIPSPVVPDKKPSVLELLSSALDKAIEATSKIPTQQVASDAAGVFQILGQVFSEAIDKVIGDDDGPEENAEVVPDNKLPEEPELESLPPPSPSPMPINGEEEVIKAESHPQEASPSDKEIVNSV